MGHIRVRYLVKNPSGYYFCPGKHLRAAGFCNEALGKDLGAAVARMNALLAEWDDLGTNEVRDAGPSHPAGTLGAPMVELRATAEWRDKADGTHKEIEYVWRTMIGPAFGRARLEAITPRVVESWCAKLRAEESVDRARRGMKWLR